MEYTFVRDGVPEKVALERWGWGVMYKSGAELHQFDDKGVFHQFKEIDFPEVKTFVMYRNDDITKRIDVPVFEDMQIFHFYRHIIFRNDTRRACVYVFGWKKGDSVCYNYILPDDRVITADRDISGLEGYGV